MAPWTLVTGFGAFPGVPDNPTARLVRRLDGRVYGGATVRAEVLDVSYERAARQVRAAVAGRGWPQRLLHFGVASGTPRVRVESRAVNRKEASVADVDGALCAAVAVDVAHPLDAVLATTVVVADLVAALNACGLPAERSDDAGRYVCNATYFQSLAWLADEGAAAPCVFVHIPDVGDGSCDPAGLPWTDERLLSCGDVALRWLTGA